MADVSKITLPDNSSYDIKDAIARNKLNVLTHNMATCATGRATAAKVATLANFSLNVGATIAVKFTDTAGTANPTSGNLTLNVNGTGAKNIGYFRNGNKAALMYSNGGYFFNNQTHIFTYDGTYWLYMDWNADNNTDTKVTSVGNHYTPAKSTTKSASGGTLTDIANSSIGTQVVTGVEMDAKGHVTGVTSIALKSTDTKVTVDSVLSSTSTNPVQNKVVKQAIDNKADKTVATTSTDGLMSAEDKDKLDAFEITTTGGKLHDKDIATTDLIPTELPANGGTAETISDWGVQTVSDANNAPYGFSNTSPDSANSPDTFWATILTVGGIANGYKQQFAFPWGAGRVTKYRVQDNGNWGSWVNIADGGNAATVNGRSAFRIPTLDGSGNLWDASTPNVNDLYAQWDASKQYFKLKTFGGNNVAVDIATSNTASGTITGLSNGAAKTVSLPFSPVFVLFHSNGHVVQGGFALSCGTNSFTITPANVSTMGSTAVGYIAFGG